MFNATGLLVAMGLLACGASTQYEPQRSDHLYLVLKDGTLSFRKNTTVVSVHSADAENLVSCSPRGQAVAHSGTAHAQEAAALMTIGALFGGIGCAITAPIATGLMRRATAESVDALNMHNDDIQCVSDRATSLTTHGAP